MSKKKFEKVFLGGSKRIGRVPEKVAAYRSTTDEFKITRRKEVVK